MIGPHPKLVILLCCLFGGCAAQPARVGKSHSVEHVVVCWLKNPGDEAARQQLINESKSFKTFPGVLRVAAGHSLPTTRPTVDSTFDLAVIIEFRDEQALKDYETNPQHLAAVERSLKPLVAKLVIYDWFSE